MAFLFQTAATADAAMNDSGSASLESVAQGLMDRAADLSSGSVSWTTARMRLSPAQLQLLDALVDAELPVDDVRMLILDWIEDLPSGSRLATLEQRAAFDDAAGQLRKEVRRVVHSDDAISRLQADAAAQGLPAVVPPVSQVTVRDGLLRFRFAQSSNVVRIDADDDFQSTLAAVHLDVASGQLPLVLIDAEESSSIQLEEVAAGIQFRQIVGRGDVIASALVRPELGYAVEHQSMKTDSGALLTRSRFVFGEQSANGRAVPDRVIHVQWIPGSDQFHVEVHLIETWSCEAGVFVSNVPAIRVEVLGEAESHFVAPPHLDGLVGDEIYVAAINGVIEHLGTAHPDHDVDGDGEVTINDLLRLYQLFTGAGWDS